MQNVKYDPVTKIYSINPSTPEEEAIKAEFRAKERLEQEAFLRKLERERSAGKHGQREKDEERKRDKQREAYMQHFRKVETWKAEGKTEAEALEILGPYPTSSSNGSNQGN